MKVRRVTQGRVPTASLVTTSQWPGPGDSEGPVDTEGWIAPETVQRTRTRIPLESDALAFTTAPWPGPGDSEG